MYHSWLFVTLHLALVVDVPKAAGVYVPGKAFDRFVTVWLENEVGEQI
jgi:hypothetical protein